MYITVNKLYITVYKMCITVFKLFLKTVYNVENYQH